MVHICRAGTDSNTDLWTQRGKRVGQILRASLKHFPRCKIANGKFLYNTGAQSDALWQPKGIGWEGGRFNREGTCGHLRLIHGDVWQKPTQHCKATILQIKKKKDSALPPQGAWILSMVGVLRSQKQGDEAKKKKDKNLTRLQQKIKLSTSQILNLRRHTILTNYTDEFFLLWWGEKGKRQEKK